MTRAVGLSYYAQVWRPRIQLDHIAIWTHNLERLKAFYEHYFAAVAGAKYANPLRQFESYFLAFSSGAQLELMHQPTLPAHDHPSFEAGVPTWQWRWVPRQKRTH